MVSNGFRVQGRPRGWTGVKSLVGRIKTGCSEEGREGFLHKGSDNRKPAT